MGQDQIVVSAAQLRFTDAGDGQRFARVRACFEQRAAEAAAATGDDDPHGPWRHYPLRKIGNFVQENWCHGRYSRNCAGYSFKEDRGDEWYTVYTLHYTSSWPEVFGLGVSAGRMAVDGDWGVSFSYTSNGAGIVGEGMSVRFSRFDGDDIVLDVLLGESISYDVEENHVVLRAPGSKDEELSALIESPESLRSTAVARLDALEAEVLRQLDQGEVRRCVYGEYHNDGIPPECVPTPLTAAEVQTAKAAAVQHFAAQREAVEDNASLLHGMLVDLMEFDRCW